MLDNITNASDLFLSMPEDNEILGVLLKPLQTHKDDRGFFREIVRFTDPFFKEERFAQWSHSRMIKNVVKAWHYHHIQTDWWYIGSGQIQTVLYDNREESATYRKKLVFPMGETTPEQLKLGMPENSYEVCIKIPPGVLHGLKVVSKEANLFYITSETYNPNEEGRIPYNSEIVPHDWGEDALTVENDRRFFTPTSQRLLINS